MNFKNVIALMLAIFALGAFARAQDGQNPQRRQGDAMRRGGEMRDGGGRFGRRAGARMPGMMNFSRLNLTDAQKQRIQALMENFSRSREAGQARRQEIGRLMRLKAQGLLTTEQGTRLTALEAQMKTEADRMRNDLLAVLTPEQKIVAEQMFNSRGGFGRGMRGERRNRMLRRSPLRNRLGRPNRPPTAPTAN